MFFNKIDAFIGKLLEVVITISLVIAVLITFLQVIFRYVLEQPLTWSQDILTISFVYSVLFGAALALRNNEHLTVDLFENASPWLARIIQVIEFVVVGTVIVVLLYYGFLLVLDNLRSGQIIGVLPIQQAYVYMAIPISAVFMLYYHVKKVFT